MGGDVRAWGLADRGQLGNQERTTSTHQDTEVVTTAMGWHEIDLASLGKIDRLVQDNPPASDLRF